MKQNNDINKIISSNGIHQKQFKYRYCIYVKYATWKWLNEIRDNYLAELVVGSTPTSQLN